MIQIRKAIHDDFIVTRMKETSVWERPVICSEQQYTSYLGLDIWLGTWNVNGKKVDEDISAWLCDGGAMHASDTVMG